MNGALSGQLIKVDYILLNQQKLKDEANLWKEENQIDKQAQQTSPTIKNKATKYSVPHGRKCQAFKRKKNTEEEEGERIEFAKQER